MGYGKDTKKVVFYENEKKHADFKIRLNYDNLSQSEFFRAIISGYIEQDEDLPQVSLRARFGFQAWDRLEQVLSEALPDLPKIVPEHSQ